ncbi:hypothetical protein KAU32_12635 [bacterium]|nr:hypothetical protein [bacterium]
MKKHTVLMFLALFMVLYSASTYDMNPEPRVTAIRVYEKHNQPDYQVGVDITTRNSHVYISGEYRDAEGNIHKLELIHATRNMSFGKNTKMLWGTSDSYYVPKTAKEMRFFLWDSSSKRNEIYYTPWIEIKVDNNLWDYGMHPNHPFNRRKR